MVDCKIILLKVNSTIDTTPIVYIYRAFKHLHYGKIYAEFASSLGDFIRLAIEVNILEH